MIHNICVQARMEVIIQPFSRTKIEVAIVIITRGVGAVDDWTKH